MPTSLSTDLYEVLMVAGYRDLGRNEPACFELSLRELQNSRGYAVAAGLEQALDYLEELQFNRDEIDYLRELPILASVPASFFDEYLSKFRFRGEVWAVPEGQVVFGMEPLLQVIGSLPEAQLIETTLLSVVLFQSMIATKARRIVDAAAGRPVMEFGARRAHGAEAGKLGARAGFIGGCSGSSQLECGMDWGIPVSGTMAHSWVLAHESERDAFHRYTELYGNASVLLVDTYDTLKAVRMIVSEGLSPSAIRLDSGDLVQLSRESRKLLDAGGKQGVKIIASGDLDEYRISDLIAANAPIDAFGVGAALSAAPDAVSLSGVYKLVEMVRNGRRVPTAKYSLQKATWPGRKQVWRVYRDDYAVYDVLCLHDEPPPEGGVPLLECVMKDGQRVKSSNSVRTAQERCLQSVEALSKGVRSLQSPDRFDVRLSDELAELNRMTQQSSVE
tara:strand:- start:8747 stop:10084 length:1338 start_codon:yes stop_codon:yes gene_type:complete